MKKLGLFAALAAILVLASCSYEMKDKFDQDASTRAHANLEEIKQTLLSAPEGWIVYYYADTQYGGYNMLWKFEGDSVTAWSQIHNDTIFSYETSVDESGATVIDTIKYLPSAKSHYKLEESAGSILSFDEYNDIIHLFSDPSSKIAGVGMDGKGYEGDFEFRVVKHSSDYIEMRGKKHQARIEMVPAPETFSVWNKKAHRQETVPFTPVLYFDSLLTVVTQMNSSNVETIVDGDTIKTTKNADYNVFSFAVPQENGTTSNTDKPFVYKLDGIYLYTPFEYNGHKISVFKYEPGDKARYYEMEDDNVHLHCLIRPINEQLVDNYWYFNSEEDLGPVAGPIFKATSDAIYESTGQTKQEICYWTRLGRVYFSTGAPNGFIFFCWNSQSYVSQCQYSYELEGEDAITLKKWAPSTYSGAKANSWIYYQDFGLGDCANCFVSTFDLETNSIKAPQYIIMRDRNNPNNVIKLNIRGRAYPFGQRDD